MFLKKLISLGGNSLIEIPNSFDCKLLDVNKKIENELINIYKTKNGFFAFFNALHFFPINHNSQYIGFEQWNEYSTWRSAYGSLANDCKFFAEDLFGNQFCILNESICFFDAESGETDKIAGNFEEWAKIILEDIDFQTGAPLASQWTNIHGDIKPNERLSPIQPFIAGGDYSIENLYIENSVDSMLRKGEMAQVFSKLEDGEEFVFNIEV
jgi:hypothetical protein